MLTAYLDYQRATFAWKCAGLSEAQLRARPVGTSALTLLGLLRHLADVERSWFRRTIAGQEAPPLYYTGPHDRESQFTAIGEADAARAFAVWRRECEAARAVVNLRNLNSVGIHAEADVSLRWVLLHMIEEYARHNGHADLVREAIDGAVGE